jgi:hypothetical protein
MRFRFGRLVGDGGGVIMIFGTKSATGQVCFPLRKVKFVDIA